MHQARFKDGTRRITHVTEVVGMEGDIITLQDLFRVRPSAWASTSTAAAGACCARPGLRPKFIDKLAASGEFVDEVALRIRAAATVSSQTLLLLGLAALFVGGTLVVAAALGSASARSTATDQVPAPALALHPVRPGAREAQQREPVERSLLGNSAVTRGALGVADRVARRRGLDGLIAVRLESAALPIRAPEWVLIHLGIALASAVLLLVVSLGNPLAALLGLIIGLTGPWMFLIVREGRRESAFLTQLPDTLQLLAGSLKAGLLPAAGDRLGRPGGRAPDLDGVQAGPWSRPGSGCRSRRPSTASPLGRRARTSAGS